MRLVLLLITSLFISFQAKSQMVSYNLMRSYTVLELDSLLTSLGFGGVVQPEYEVDVYKVIYKTPYIHPDSLVNVSGAVMIPRGIDCPLPLSSYLHGTTSRSHGAPSYFSPETNIGIFFAALGSVAALPDYLGLGDSDSSIIIHPYIHAFSQGHSSVNMLRATRQLADTLDVELNEQLFLTGYSQGGFTTVATHKLIEEQFSNEFTVTASIPMSGPYDLKVAQVDQITSSTPYASPGYLPYIVLGYHSVFKSLQQRYPDVTKFFKPPYDSIMPALFYGKQTHMGIINNNSESVPKLMLVDSLVTEFENDSLHPLRLALAESHLLDWTPQAPIRLLYCNGDDQVTYLNSERAYDSWTSRGATQVEKFDLGNKKHGECLTPALGSMVFYLKSQITICTGVEDISTTELNVYPNPASSNLFVQIPENELGKNYRLSIYDLSGKQLMLIEPQSILETISVNYLNAGIYFLEYRGDVIYRNKLVVK